MMVKFIKCLNSCGDCPAYQTRPADHIGGVPETASCDLLKRAIGLAEPLKVDYDCPLLPVNKIKRQRPEINALMIAITQLEQQFIAVSEIAYDIELFSDEAMMQCAFHTGLFEGLRHTAFNLADSITEKELRGGE